MSQRQTKPKGSGHQLVALGNKQPYLPTALAGLGLVTLTWIIFGRTAGFGFINYDDNLYVYQNSDITNGLTRLGLLRAFTRPLVGNWHPLTSISLMLDAQWSGLHAGGYHIVNVLLHTIAVLLLFFVLKAMTGALWRSAFVAALFAIHPLRAESVVWISERKDVLSGVFFFLAILAYHRYVNKPTIGRYLLVVTPFVLGLLSKAMLVTFPFVLLLLDYWPLQRCALQEKQGKTANVPGLTWLIIEKLPFVAIGVVISILTLWAQAPALRAGEHWPLYERLGNAIVTIWTYLRQMFWPADLAVFYPYPKTSLPFWLVGLALMATLAVTLGVVIGRKRYPYLLTGWFWYLGMLVPVIGLVQVGWQGHADRYTYLPEIGLYLIVTWGATDLTTTWPNRNLIRVSAAAVILSALILLSWRQVGYWSSSISLWRHTLAVTSNNDVAERGLGTALIPTGQIDEAISHDRAALRIRPGDTNGLTNLADALLRKGELPEAIEHFREVVRARPNDSEAHRNLGKALYQTGAIDEALTQFREALRVRPDDADAAYSLGNAFLQKGDTREAIAYFQKAILAEPRNVAAHYNLAVAFQRERRWDEAIAAFRATLRLAPQHVDAHNNLAIVLLNQGQTNDAIAEWQAALRIQPLNAEIHNNLGAAFLQAGKIREAIAEYREALRLQPEKTATALTLAWILATAPEATLRDGGSALDLAKRAFQLAAEHNLMTYRVLAAAFAENAQFQAASNAAREGIQRADAAGQSTIAEALRNDLAFYEQNVPVRDSSHGRGPAGGP